MMMVVEAVALVSPWLSGGGGGKIFEKCLWRKLEIEFVAVVVDDEEMSENW